MPKNEQSSSKTAYTKTQATVYDETRFITKAGIKIHEMELSKVLNLLSKVPKTAKITEIGCGTGRILMECLDKGYQVDGVDASVNMLEELRNKLKDHPATIKLDTAEAAKLPYDDDSYDVAYSVRLLNQTESSEYALSIIKEMVRIVKPGGYILVECVNEKRVRVGSNKTSTTRLKSDDMIAEGVKAGATYKKLDGAFFVGMTAYHKSGNLGVPFVNSLDIVLSRMFPDLCSRIYVLFQK